MSSSVLENSKLVIGLVIGFLIGGWFALKLPCKDGLVVGKVENLGVKVHKDGLVLGIEVLKPYTKSLNLKLGCCNEGIFITSKIDWTLGDKNTHTKLRRRTAIDVETWKIITCSL